MTPVGSPPCCYQIPKTEQRIVVTKKWFLEFSNCYDVVLYHSGPTVQNQNMQALSQPTQDVLVTMTRGNQMSENDMMDVAARVPTLLDATNVRKVRFYQLWFRGQWVKKSDKIIRLDPTDRFYEVCDKLAEMVVTSMNHLQATPKAIFVMEGTKFIAIKPQYINYQDLINIIEMYLPGDKYWFGINEYDVNY